MNFEKRISLLHHKVSEIFSSNIHLFSLNKNGTTIWFVSGARTRFFGFAKIVTERVFAGILLIYGKQF